MSTTVTKADLTTYVAALEARLTVATEVYKNQRALIATLEARLATPGVKPTPTPIVTRFRDSDGDLWIKTRIGNRATSRLAELVSAGRDGAPAVWA